MDLFDLVNLPLVILALSITFVIISLHLKTERLGEGLRKNPLQRGTPTEVAECEIFSDCEDIDLAELERKSSPERRLTLGSWPREAMRFFKKRVLRACDVRIKGFIPRPGMKIYIPDKPGRDERIVRETTFIDFCSDGRRFLCQSPTGKKFRRSIEDILAPA